MYSFPRVDITKCCKVDDLRQWKRTLSPVVVLGLGVQNPGVAVQAHSRATRATPFCLLTSWRLLLVVLAVPSVSVSLPSLKQQQSMELGPFQARVISSPILHSLLPKRLFPNQVVFEVLDGYEFWGDI